MDNLRAYGLVDVVRQVIARGTPFLGICLGMQLLFDESEEFGPVRGLGVFPGRVVRFADRPRPAGAAHGVEPDPQAAERAAPAGHRRRRVRVLRALVLRGAGGPVADGDDDRVRRRVHVGDRARQRVRHAVPPGEEPGGRAEDPGELRARGEGNSCSCSVARRVEHEHDTVRELSYADSSGHRSEGRQLRPPAARRPERGDRVRRRPRGHGAALGGRGRASTCTSSTSTAP